MQTKLAQIAIRTSLLYGLVSCLWIALSDRLLVAIVSDPPTIGRLATYKGWAFVVVTGLLLYSTLHSQLRRWEKEVEDRTVAEEALLESKNRYRSLFENMLVGYAYCRMVHEDAKPVDFVYLDVNPAFERLTGLKEVVGKKVSEVVPGIRETVPELFEIYSRVALTGAPEKFELYLDPLRSWFSIAVYSPEKGYFVAIFDNITEHKRTADAREAAVGLLRLCNEAGSSQELMQTLTRYFQELTGCEAVGVRLHEGDDFPYYETKGFPEEFVRLENSLCAFDPKGELVRDSAGHPALECMCGNILCGRFDPSKPFFTPRGSFWSSCTTELLKNTTDADRQAKTRNRCNGEGYESVALVPLRSQGETFGLVQFNDRRKGRFTAEKIALLEDLVDCAAIALAKMKSDKALQEASQLNQQIINGAEEGIIVHGRDLRFQVWNPFMEHVSGLPASEVLGKLPQEVFPFLQEGGSIKRLEMALAGQTSGIIEFPFHYPRSGRSGWLSDTYAPLRDGKGRIIGAIATVRDITERKQAEESIRKSEAKYRKLHESMRDGFVFVGMEGTITDCNESYREMTGYTLEELIKLTYRDLTPEKWHGFEQEIVEQQILSRGYSDVYEKEYRKKDGTTFPVELRTFLIKDETDRPAGMWAIVRDITRRKHVEAALRLSEEKFKDLFDRAPVGFVEYDARGVMTNTNRTILDMLGYSAEETIGQYVWKLSDNEEIAREGILSKLAKTESPARNLRRMYRKKDGSTFPVLLEDRVILDERGRIKGVRSTVQDITDLQRAEEEKASLQDQLRQSHKMEAIGTLAGGIAHDFNNILSSVLGYAELAGLDLDGASKAKYNLEQSMKAAHRAKDLVQQILSFSRHGKQERKLLDLRPVIKESLKFLRASLPATIQIRQEVEDDIGPIETDPTRIHQVVMNLCTNAAHAMGEGGGFIDIFLAKADVEAGSIPASQGIEPGPYLRLRVSDTGQGMSPEVLKRIFDPYFTTKEVGKGTGLGLAVVHGIVKDHGGGITVSSQVGKGSVFDVYLPRTEPMQAPSKVDSDETIPLGRHERILFVDDEQAIAEITRNILKHLGYEVTARTSSIEALELFRVNRDRFDLVITDITMPNMTGDKLAQELVKIRPEIPIILCTGFSEHVTKEKAKTIGIRDYLMKPLVMKDMAKAIRRVLDNEKQTQEQTPG